MMHIVNSKYMYATFAQMDSKTQCNRLVTEFHHRNDQYRKDEVVK